MSRRRATYVGVSWTESSSRLEVSVPDSIHFPSDECWIWLKDNRTVLLDPNPPPASCGAERRKLSRKRTAPGCRFVSLYFVKLDPPFFGMADTRYRVDGERLVVTIPAPEDRIPPRRRRLKNTATDTDTPAPAVLTVKVLVAWTEFGLDDDAVIDVPIEVAKALVSQYKEGRP